MFFILEAIMFKKILCLVALVGLAGFSYAEPLDKAPRIKKILITVAPENYEATITLKSGEKIVVERIALTEASLSRRFTLNAIDKTVRVLPKGETERKTINTSDIEKIEIVKVKDKPETVPQVK